MRYTRFIALLATMLVSVACFQDDLDFGGERIDTESDIITIYGNVARFADCEVSTRANKTPEESYVSKMALAVFTEDGNECIHYELRDGSNLLYTLDRAKIRETCEDKYSDETRYDDVPCVMYIFANMPDLPSDGYEGSLAYLLNLAYTAPGLTRPDTGFPMIGSLGDVDRDGKSFVLIPMSGNRMELPTVDKTPTDYLNIPMSAIFAKISFEITVSPDQDVDVHAPARFEMTGYEVHNLPKAVSFNSEKNTEGIQEVSSELVEVAISGIAQGGDEGSGSKIEFDFYLPERLVTPETSAEAFDKYPLGENGEYVTGYSQIPAKNKKYAQRYKPLLLGKDQKPTYITIKGKYRDHHEYKYDVDYDIYLGADNYGDFNIERNNQYYNKLNIKGIASSNDQTQNENSISIDHRVNVEHSSPLIVSIRRETQLDAHFEVRPMRLRISGDEVPDGAKAVVEVLDENGVGGDNIPTWVRLEKSGTTDAHITTGASAGKRKYFTTNLVTETLKDNYHIEVLKSELSTTDNSTVWIYVDEADPDKATTTRTTRSATIRVTYTDDEGNNDVKDYHISQYNLHEIEGEYYKQKYHIECYEEYLYNYDSEDSYGQIREEGLPWGLNGEQLSHRYMSFNQATHAPNIDWGKYKNSDGTVAVPPYYDFYTSKYDSFANDYGGEVHDATTYPGCEFTKQIAEYSNSVKYLDLSQQANSAVEYCYSRNKRNPDGTVDVKWYLPSVDELEDFIVPAFNYYKEFQENYYWTSQPAYIRNVFYYEYQANRFDSKKISHPKVYDDNKTHARATKLVNSQSTLTPIPSGLNTSPNPEVNRMPNDTNNIDYENFGYFNEMHFYHHRYQGLFSGLEEDGGPTKTPSVNGRDEQSAHDGYTYYFHLDHLGDLIQKTVVNGKEETGYLPRTESHRVRCVRKVENN